MAQEHDLETKFGAEDLYVESRLTLEEVAERTGLPIGTLRRWSSDGNWKGLRRDRAEAKRSLRQSMFDLRQAMMQKAITSKDAQDVYAAIRLERVAIDQARDHSDQAGVQMADIDMPKIFLEHMEFVAEVLMETDPEGLKVLAGSFDEIVRRFKELNAQTA